MEALKKILKPKQPELKKLLEEYLIKQGYKPVIGDGFLYAQGDIPVMLVAHMDTVHTRHPSEIYYDKEQDVMWSPQGIGGDDRCGVYAIMKILETHKPYVLFTEDEEMGCVGADKFVRTIIPADVKFIIEIDRRGKDDCVFYDCGNEEFKKYIQNFGFKLAIGSFSDIVYISDEWEVASVNLSAGYYQEHSTSEIIKFNQLTETIEKVKEILDDEKNVGTFDYKRVKETYNYYNNYNNFYKDDYTEIDENIYMNTKTGEIVESSDYLD
jgi:hypothetical protein